MSVQAGIWNLDGSPIERSFLKNFSESLEGPGPDGLLLREYGSLAFIYRPFHTTPESLDETQPYVTGRGFLITFDGRIDNRPELIQELHENIDPNSTDVCILGACFDRWTTDCFRRIVGEWAVTIWIPSEQKLILARDYVGVRQLFLLTSHRRLRWCTSLEKLVLMSQTELTLNQDYIAGYLFLWPDANLSPYQQIRPVPPGGVIECTGDKVSFQSYWQFRQQSTRYKHDVEYEEHFRHLFRQAVRRRLRSHTPILAELSGGLDSSSIVCVADEIIAQEFCSVRLDTKSRFDPSEPGGDERVYFSKIEEKRGRKGVHVNTSTLPQTIPLKFHQFVALPGTLGNGAREAAPILGPAPEMSYRVLLSGIGGDELTGGVPDPGPQLSQLALTLHWKQLARQLFEWSVVKRRPWIQVLGISLFSSLPLWLRIHLARNYKPMPWLHAEFLPRYCNTIYQLGKGACRGCWLPAARDSAETVATISRQMAFNSITQRACQERRYPYLDQSLVEFLTSIPAEQLLRPGERRSLVRRALRDTLPDEVRSRPTKSVSARAYMAAFERQWHQLETLFDDSRCASFRFINPSEFLAALRTAKDGDAPHLLRLLRTIGLEIWLRDLEERRVIRVPASNSAPMRKKTAVKFLVPG
jgi:asparagine synthase (glutamine-hydrolysing)